jgi:hypothetical protein
MAITTSEFEQSLNDFLTRMENSKRCEWCGDDDRHMGPRSKLCNSCKEWRRRERRALEWKRKFPNRVDEESLRRYEYPIQYAALCRAAGTLHSWDGPISPLDLEREIEALTKRFLGESVFGSSATFLFAQFSPAQRRLLKYMFQGITNVWLRHHRQGFATDEVMNKAFPAAKSSRGE